MKNSPKLNRKLDDAYDEFLTQLESEEHEAYLGLTKSYELGYMKEARRFSFKRYFQSIPYSTKPLSILDIGTTPFTFFIKRFYPHYNVSTIDLTSLLEQRAEKAGVTLKQCDLTREKIPFADDSFDMVIFTAVIEHLYAPPQKVLGEISRILKRDAVLIFDTPNQARLTNRIRLLFGINPQRPIKEPLEVTSQSYGHVREYTMKECIQELKASGFSITKGRFYDELALKSRNAGLLYSYWLLPLRIAYWLIGHIFPPFKSCILIIAINNKTPKIGMQG